MCELPSSPEQLFNVLLDCDICGRNKYGKTPFVFPYRNQNVMLITVCPSLQAMHRPITSVRFFRQLIEALYGEKNVSLDVVEDFFSSIYWTHYRKCYVENASVGGDYRNINNVCYNRYLMQEINILKPKKIIIIGSWLAKKILKEDLSLDSINKLNNEVIKLAKWDAEIMVTDFPAVGNIDRFNELQQFLYKSGKREKKEINTSKFNLEDLRNNYHHLSFDLGVLNRYIENFDLNTSQMVLDGNIWQERVIIPNKINSMKIVEMHNFIEDQIKTYLLDKLSYKKNWLIIKKYRKLNLIENLDQKRVYEDIRDQWRGMFFDLLVNEIEINENGNQIKFCDGRYITKYDARELKELLSELSNIRNSIVHAGGYIEPFKVVNEEKINFSGIHKYVNFLSVTKEGVLNIRNYIYEIVNIINQIA